MSERIVDLRAVALTPLPLAEPFRTSYEAVLTVESVVVRVETEDGAVGFGEAVPATLVTGDTQGTVTAVVDYLREAHLTPGHGLLGRPLATLADAEAISRDLRGADEVGLVAANPAARAGIEQALLDLLARRAGSGYGAVLGAGDHGVRSTLTAGIRPVDEVLALVEGMRPLAPSLVRFKLGGSRMHERDVAVTREVHRLVSTWPSPPALAADANQGFAAPDDAVAFLTAVDGLLSWLEQPCPVGTVTAFADIRPRVGTRLMADESVHGTESFRLLDALGGVDLVNVKLMKCGGVLSGLALLREIAGRGLRGYVGSMIESGLGTLAAIATAATAHDVVEGNDTLGVALLAADPWHCVDVADLVVAPRPLRPAAELDALVAHLAAPVAAGG